MQPEGVELSSQEPESYVLSITLGLQNLHLLF